MTESSKTTNLVAAHPSWWGTCLAALLLILGGILAFPGVVLIGWARRLSPELRAKLDARLAPMMARFLERRR